MLPSKDDLLALPTFAPLIAAVIAPLSTLLDIPALTEPWFFQQNSSTGNMSPLPDPHANLALSAIGLAFNIAANGLLIIRFSVSDGVWRYATRASLICWIMKFGIALGNILVFGILTRNTPGISYGEAFWCAVVSLIISLVIVGLLLCHYQLHVRGKKGSRTSDTQLEVRIAGRHFMLQNTLFVATVGILALFMSRVEKWTYLQGIYFSVVAFLTVGFGDFYPTKPSTQIVLFPFVLIGIVQLASIVELIVRFFRSRLASRHSQTRREYEMRRQEKENELEGEPNLEAELQFLRNLYNERDNWKTVRDLMANGAGFLVFWIIGALIFSQIESWTYGQGLYFCYVFFFTIGFGDYAPITPAGRVIFVIYSILAVPIMASFAVQTIQSIFQQLSTDLLRRKQAEVGVGEGAVEEETLGETMKLAKGEDEEKNLPEDVRNRLKHNDGGRKYRKSHTDFIAEEHERIDSRLSKSASGQSAKKGDVDRDAEEGAQEREREREREEDRILTEYILELAVELERHARRLLLCHMEEGSSARMLLKADRIVQLRNIKGLAKQEQSDQEGSEHMEGSSNIDASTPGSSKAGGKGAVNAMMQKYYEEEADLVPFPSDLDDRETLEEVSRYREAFAGLLAAGSRLLRLKNQEKFMFERRYWNQKEGASE